MSQHLSPTNLEKLIQVADLEQHDVEHIIQLFRDDQRLQDKLPNGAFAIDPRSGDRVLFNPARARRPHDTEMKRVDSAGASADCPICAGDTTGIIDSVDLSQGTTFINKNLFPIMYPFPDEPARGLHFLQWTSSFHDRDWHNMPLADCRIVLRRLAALESKWIKEGRALAPEVRSSPYVSIIKNAGSVVGASLSHGHQQIAVGNIMPRRIKDHLQFKEHHQQTFSQWLLDRLAPELIIQDYGPAVLAVPHFMKRPYDMLLLMRDTEKAYLHQLSPGEFAAAAEGWHQATAAIHHLLPLTGLDSAYNVLVHNGPGAGLYLEFKPHTQISGGYEHIGLHICQGSPAAAAEDLRAAIEQA